MDRRTSGRTRTLAGVTLFVALALHSVVSVASAQTTLRVSGHDGGGEFWFEVDGVEGRNPTVVLPPGEEVTVEFVNEGQAAHNVRFPPPIDQATEIVGSGESATLTFTVPQDATGQFEYWCDPHRELGMLGQLQFGEGPSTPGGGAPPTGAPPGGSDVVDGGEESGGSIAEPGTIGLAGFVLVLALIFGVALSIIRGPGGGS